MAGAERTQFIGRLGKDPELRFTSDNKAVCNFSVAVDRGWGESKKTVWYKVAVWEKKAEACNQYLHKGSKVYVEGNMQEPRPWQNKAGEWMASLEITAYTVEFLDSKSASGEGQPWETPAESPVSGSAVKSEDSFGDEIPF